MTQDLLIRGGTIIDSAGRRAGDLAVVDGVIAPPDQASSGARIVDAQDCFVSTGLVDMHAHLGEPGDEAAETMHSAGRAAVLGGFTTVLAMPDTIPPVDTAAVVEHIRALAKAALCSVEVAGTVTVGAAGERLAPLGELAAAGVRLVTDHGSGVQDPLLLRRALEYARPFGLTIGQPADCAALSVGAQMHEGEWSSRLGLAGAPAEAEEIMVMRDISLARLSGSRLHFQTLSTAGSFAMVGAAARSGVAVSAEIASHHLLLRDADLAEYDTNKKVFPPLRDGTDVEAGVEGVTDGLIDAIVSDHTPQTTDRKERPFDMAEPGSVGLETALAVALSSGLAIESVLQAMSWRPAELLGMGTPAVRTLAPGCRADITVIDPEERFTVSTSSQATTGTNSAFEGRDLRGRTRATVVGGELVVDKGALIRCGAVTPAALVLADGTVFEGESFGAIPPNGVASGEVVFNTVLSGYQEVITDPSYAGQIVTFTYPHLGNYGVNRADHESRRPFLRGVIARDVPRRHSNWRSDGDLDSFLVEQGVAGIASIDTRRLTRHIRDIGAMPGAFGTADEATLRTAAESEPGTDGIDMVATVTCDEPYVVDTRRNDGRKPWNLIAIDFGVKSTILEQLSLIGGVTVVPASTAAPAILDQRPDGIFLSNGPGDPDYVAGAVETIDGLLGEVPVFGICLGHQLLSLTLGLEAFKLPFGHHGGNHPVRNLADGTVEITSQNHNFCVADDRVAGVELTHVNLNDQTVEGIRSLEVPAFSVQYHPEAGPGPHDSRYLFDRFDQLMVDHWAPDNNRGVA